ncbi:flp pilus-assembly TadE/G-like family protein [Staphylococcus chromogenes]|nr:flp pilus-assembly TadE/G-like family protein [Staphylococcus chromogenes]
MKQMFLKAGSDEDGHMTIVAAATSAAAIALFGVAAFAAGQVIAIHRAQVAADMSAVAGAFAVFEEQQPCSVARDVAARNGAELEDCAVEGGDVRVSTSVRNRFATAKAGPI